MSQNISPMELGAIANKTERAPGDELLKVAVANGLLVARETWSREQWTALAGQLTASAAAFLDHYFGDGHEYLRTAIHARMTQDELAAVLDQRQWQWELAARESETMRRGFVVGHP
jgi:2-hydroxychromene-2-carboxylate isomerase